MNKRQLRLLPELRDRREIGRAFVEKAGHVVLGQRQIRVHAPVDAVEIVDMSFAFEQRGLCKAILEVRTVGDAFVNDEADTDHMVVAHGFADRLMNHQAEARAIRDRPAEPIRAPVRTW
jgi:hypothetical protein